MLRWCHLINFMLSFCSLSNAVNSRIMARTPPLNALRDAIALPSTVRAPVDLSHGCHCLIFSDCCARCSGVQCRAAMLRL
jgi:hypothetical protein